MVQAVNLAVKDHAAMLKEVETLEPVTVEAFGQGININDWADLLCWGNTTIPPGFDLRGRFGHPLLGLMITSR